MRVLVIMLVLAIAGCAAAEGQVEDAVRSVLKDPESARFQSVGVAEVNGVRVACGQVNAKNSMGGYTGDRAFMLKGDQLWMATSSEESTAVLITCSLTQAGGDLSDQQAADFALWASRLPVPISIN